MSVQHLMRLILTIPLLLSALLGQAPKPIPAADATRIVEFYRLAPLIDDKIWPGWSKIPAPLLFVTHDTEFLTHFENPPKEFQKVGDNLYARAPVFSRSASDVSGVWISSRHRDRRADQYTKQDQHSVAVRSHARALSSIAVGTARSE